MGTAMPRSNSISSLRLGVCSLLVLLAPAAWAQQELLSYARECAEKIGPIPAFSCLDGTRVPITVDNKVPAAYVPQMTCDRPSLLPPGPGENTDGQCIPESRALVLRDDGKVQISAYCRQKKIRPAGTSLYDEVDLISHNVETGSTCWFQALAPNPLSADKGLDGRRVPSPEEAAKNFWNTPAKTASANCGACHDSDPFMYSPLIGQTGKMPRDPLGLYANDIGEDFKKWPKPLSLSTRGNTCTGCHRIGSQHTCNTAMYESIGEQPSPYQDGWAIVYPNSHWMPPGLSMNLAQWKLTYRQSVEELARCCKDPKAAGCIATPITGLRP
jgi:hypothetical protein